MDFVRTPESRFRNLPSFPYKPHYVNLPSSKQFRLSYIDESTPNYSPTKSNTFLCLHGEPTWSYLYRKIIPVLLDSNKIHNHGVRVICPDFIGFGRSDKPTNPSIHTFKYHRNTIIELLQYLKLDNNSVNITLIAQDWGGLIGLSLPISFISYSVNNTLAKVIQTNNNPIKRIIFFNTVIPLGDRMPKSFLNWRKFSRNSVDLDIFGVMKMMGLSITNEEINGYIAPFPDAKYKVAARYFPSNVPIHPEYEGLDIWHKAFFFYQRNKLLGDNNKNKIKLFYAHGCCDMLFNIKSVIENYKIYIDRRNEYGLDVRYGISSETGGVLWVANGGHFLQESVDIDWVIKKALKFFGDIPYDDIEYEWIVSPNTNKIDIIKITLNKPPVNVLSYNMINGLNNILQKFNNSKYCNGFILTSNIPKSRKNKKVQIFSPGYDLLLFAQKNRQLTKDYFYALRKMDYLLNTSRKPIIAALNGSVIAGSTLLSLACDYRIMFNDSFISMNEVRNGIQFSGTEIHEFIKRFVGSDDKAMYVLQTGKYIYAKEAKEFGLINKNLPQRNMKLLFDECIKVLEQDYFKADKEAAYISKQLSRKGSFKHYNEYTEKDANAYADTFFAPAVQKAIQKFAKGRKKSKL